MRLSYERLELNNYRYYYGEQEIIFSTTPEKNVVVIKGDNGAGKSNILNAMTWCLYGTEVHIDKKAVGLPIMNTRYIAELAEKGLEGECSVTLTLNVDGDLWVVKRSVSGYGEKDKTWTAESPKYRFIEVNRSLLVTFPVNNGHQSVLNEVAQAKIAELLPDDLRSFFFIDGEQLHEFFKKDASRNLKNAIEKLSQLDIVDSAISSLKTYRDDLRKKIRATNPNLTGIHEKIANAEQMLERLKNAKKNISDKNTSLEIQKEEIDLFLENYNIQDIKYLSQEIQTAERELKSEKERLAKIEHRKREYILEVAPSIFMKDTIKEAYGVIDTLIERGTLPPMIRESFIHELLEEGICVCGTKLTSESRKVLKEYAEKIQISEMDSIAQEGKGEFLNHLDNIRKFPSRMDEFNEQINESEEKIERYEEEIQNKRNSLLSHNIDEINSKMRERENLLKNIGENTSKIKQTEIQLRTKNEEYKKLLLEEETEKEKSQIHSEHQDRFDVVLKILDILERVEERVKSRIRQSLEENTKKYFFEFLREDAFRDVTISDNYEIAVINKEGWNNLGDLSAGQYLVLGYAFVVALRAITGYQAPVFVDTPLGKLDQTHQDNITRNLPRLLDSAQLVFLVTSSEYTPTVKENFSKFMSEDSYYEIHRYSDITSARLVHHGL